MRVDHVVDERRDPFLASEAAARLLRSNYERLGTWPLAITAYNHGPGGLAKAVRLHGTRDIGAIVARYRSPSFGFASRNFYAEFLAARRIDQSPERYFGPIRKEPPHEHESVVLRRSYGAGSLAQALGIGIAQLRDWNPALLSPVWTGSRQVPAAYEVRVPRRADRPPASELVAGTQGRGWRGAPPAPRAPAELASTPRPAAEETGAEALRRPARPAAAPAAVATIHRVARGETLFEIGRRYGVSMAKIAASNDIRDPRDIREGQQLEIPAPPSAALPVPVAAAEAAPAPAPEATPPPGAAAAPGGAAEAAPADAAPSAPTPAEAAPSDAAASAPAPTAPAPAGAAPADAEGAEPAPAEPAPEPAPAAGPGPAAAPPAEAEPAPAEPGSYTVAAGDTLGAIAARLGVSAEALAAANGVDDPRRLRPGQRLSVPEPGAAPAAPLPAAEPETTWRVRPGDTLGSIAKSTGVPAERLASHNGIDDPRRLRPGQRLRIPGGRAEARDAPERVYTVRAGDTLYSIASRHGLRVADLAAQNGLRNRHRLSIGQRLRLPPSRSAEGS
jgi:membrane-bound lytic murein transglycosylase D